MFAEQHRAAVVAVAIAAVMVLSTLAGVSAASPHALPGASPDRSDAPTPAVASGFHLPALASQLSAPRAPSALPAPNSRPGAPSAPAVVTGAVPTDRTAATLSSLRASGVPLRDAFLPDLNTEPHPALSANGTVVPTYQTGEPAPVGVAEYGVVNESGTLVPENLTTTTLIGSFVGENPGCAFYTGDCTPSVLAMDSGAPDAYGLQLNAVLQNVTLFNTPGYEFWTQNVIEYSTFSHELYIITNIWNFSSYGAVVSGNFLSSYGPNGTVVPGDLYYSVSGPYVIGPVYQAQIALETTLVRGNDEVAFYFYINNATETYRGENDFAIFNSTGAGGPGASSAAVYVASGSVYTPVGIPSDWEFVMGGPGGGSNLDVFSMYSTMDLYYYNSTFDEFQVVPSAYNAGSETGETSAGADTIWEGDWSDTLAGGPGVDVVPGPTFVHGLWNVSNSTQGVSFLDFGLAPSNGFTFFGPFDAFNFSAFAWAPPDRFGIYFLPPGNYTVWGVASNYYAEYTQVSLGNGSTVTTGLDLGFSDFVGVYTPLWALNETGLENITWNGYTLFNNEFGPLGDDVGQGVYFPWFAEMNDYAYPVFAGILLWNVSYAGIVDPPSFEVEFPALYDRFLDYYGLPSTNNLPILVYDSDGVVLAGASAITGWWFTLADFGPTVPQYNVVFWNSSYSEIEDNTFLTSSSALYLYGGINNQIANNTFLQYLPAAPDPYALSGYYFGTYALFEADYGEYDLGDFCGCYDVVVNNDFDTYFTAYSPLADPYTGGYPLLPFSEEWNVPRLNGTTNIVGGDYLGGNYWWNYGTAENPYGELPYDNFALDYLFIWGLDPVGIFWQGDFVPLTLTPLYTVTFVEVGLPAGTEWTPAVETVDGTILNYTTLDYANESWTAGVYNLSASAFTNLYYYNGSSYLVVTGNETIVMVFDPLFVISIEETGLPTGTYWEALAFNFTTESYNSSTTEWLNLTVAPGEYYYDAFTYADYASPDGSGYLNVTGNTTLVLAFLPLFSLTLTETGLPTGGLWTIILESNGGINGSEMFNNSTVFVGYLFAGYTYDWSVVATGYVATPSSGAVELEANTTVSVAFAATATITFDESGLGAGSAWTVTFVQGASSTTQTSTAASIVFDAVAGAYSYTVRAENYTPNHPTGTGTLPADATVSETFGVADGTISGTVGPTVAAVTIGGTPVTVGSGGTYSASLAPGTYEVKVSAPGYYPYYTNTTVASGKTDTLNVALHAIPAAAAKPLLGISGSSGWIVIGVLAALVVLLVVALLVLRARRPPAAPPPKGWSEGAAGTAGGGTPPATSTPDWSEGGSTSPPPGAK